MVLPVLRPMTIATATGLVAGSAFSSYTTVYADEHQYDNRLGRHVNNEHNDRRGSYEDYKRRFSNKHSMLAQEEELLPGLIYVALAGLSGSLVARQRNVLIRMFSPLAFATAAGAYFLPHTTHSVIDAISSPMASTYPTHPAINGHHRSGMSQPSWLSSPYSSSLSQDNNELTYRSRDAWQGVESRAGQSRDSAHENAHKAQHWMEGKAREAGEATDGLCSEANRPHKRSSGWFHMREDEVEDEFEGKVKEAAAEKAKDKAQGVSSWFSAKTYEAEKAVEDATQKAKDRVGDQTAAIEQKINASAKDTDEWWMAQAAQEEKRTAEKKAHERKEAEKAWFRRQRAGKEHPEHPDHPKWWSARYNSAGAIVGAGVGLDAADHHPPTRRKPRGQFPSDPSLTHHYNHPHHNSFLGTASDFGTDGALDDEDVEEHDLDLGKPGSTTTRKPKKQFPSDPSLTHHYNHPHHNSFLGTASDFGTDGALDDEDVEEHDLDLGKPGSTTTRKPKKQFPSDPSLTHHYNHPHHNSFLGTASDFGTDGALDDEDVEEHDLDLGKPGSTTTRKPKKQFPSDPSLTHHYNHPHHNSFLGTASDFGTDGALDDEDVEEHDLDLGKPGPTTTRKPKKQFPSDPSLTHHYNHPHHNSFLGTASDFGTDGALDDEDVEEHDLDLGKPGSTTTRKPKKQFPSDPSLTHHYNHPHHNSFLGTASDFGTDGALDDEDVEEHDLDLGKPGSTTTRKPKKQFPSDPSLTHHYNHPHHNSFLGTASDFGTDGALDDEDVEEHDLDLGKPGSTTTRKPKKQFPSDPSLTHHYNHPHHNSFLGTASDFGTDGALDDEDVEEHDLDLGKPGSTTTRKPKKQFPSDPSLTHHYNHPHHNSFLGTASDFGTDGALDDEDVEEHDLDLERPRSTKNSEGRFPSDSSLPHDNSYLGTTPGFGSSGALDNEDVKRWSSVREAMGTHTHNEHLFDHRLPHHYHNDWALGLEGYHPDGQPEYWSNGDEISTSSVRDAGYYNYPGSFRDSSLNRASWWSSHLHTSNRDYDSHMAELRRRAEALAWETKQAEERAAYDLANKLADEQAVLERSAAEAKKRAEAAVRRAKAQSEALIRERQLAVERAAYEAELRFRAETENAERAADEAKAKAYAWELEQRAKAEQAAREVQDRVLHQKLAAETAAENLKAQADAWAREQKEKADAAALEIHEHVMRETAAAERSARDAKVALEAKIRAEKDKLERDAHELVEKILHEKSREEQVATELRTRAETLVQEQKLKAEKVAREMEERLSFEKRRASERAATELADRKAYEKAEAEALAAKARAESLLAEARRSAELSSRGLRDDLKMSSTSNSSGWSWPWPSKASTAETSTEMKQAHDHEGFDSSRQLLEHIAEDIRQTKDDFQDGLGHLKDAVLGAESKAAETVRDAFATERSRLSSSSDSGSHDRPHEHHLMDHIREDLRQTKDDVEQLKGALFGAEKHAAEAVSEATKAEKATSEGRGWWSARTKEYERKIAEVDSEMRAGLTKAGDKMREMDRESSASADDHWFRNEQSHQQRQRRESGRAM